MFERYDIDVGDVDPDDEDERELQMADVDDFFEEEVDAELDYGDDVDLGEDEI